MHEPHSSQGFWGVVERQPDLLGVLHGAGYSLMPVQVVCQVARARDAQPSPGGSRPLKELVSLGLIALGLARPGRFRSRPHIALRSQPRDALRSGQVPATIAAVGVRVAGARLAADCSVFGHVAVSGSAAVSLLPAPPDRGSTAGRRTRSPLGRDRDRRAFRTTSRRPPGDPFGEPLSQPARAALHRVGEARRAGSAASTSPTCGSCRELSGY